MAGKAWLYAFLKRHPEIRLHSPEPTSLARTMDYFTPDNIYNVDGTGISTVTSKQIKVLGLRGKRQVGGLSSAERGVLVTAEIFTSASGNFVPTVFVFPLARENKELLDNEPPGSTTEYHPSAWMQKEIFIK
jgi:hypothetical protein